MQVKQVKRLIRIKPVYRVMKGSQRLKLPGFEGLSFYVVSKFFIEGLKNGALNMRASSLAFSFFLALFPTIIFLFTLIPYIPIDNFQDYLFNLLQNIMPKSAFEATEGTIADIIKNQRGGLLSFGFLSALYFSTNGFNAMINAFNETYHDIETRTAIGQRLASFYMLFITVILISTAIGLVIGTEIGFKYLIHKDKALYYILNTGKWIILAVLCYSLISFHYYLGPKEKKGWRFFSAGSMFATVLIIIASLAFGYYVNNFGNYNKLYGSIGTLIVIMMWIYINSLILLLGFDLNVSIHSAKKQSLIRLHLLGHH
ncbi:MAG: YihY/virulence factor BrkB family protein [Bacteroidia bacterium]|nr:YihY/virulence factor BrkB family protein [Bacteroidia bacterium]MCK6648772.1 YihY/virulence factor BrkB family protein [Bacteroidia bacterium]